MPAVSRIPKESGGERRLGISALEDKIVQHAVVTVLNAIYEEDFLGFSYGFRPGRDPHRALDALWVGLTERPIGWVLDMDVEGFFDHLLHDWLIRFLEHRTADKRVIRRLCDRGEGRPELVVLRRLSVGWLPHNSPKGKCRNTKSRVSI